MEPPCDYHHDLPGLAKACTCHRSGMLKLALDGEWDFSNVCRVLHTFTSQGIPALYVKATKSASASSSCIGCQVSNCECVHQIASCQECIKKRIPCIKMMPLAK